MNKFFANKDVLVAVFKLAPNPTEELRKFRFNKIMQMLEEAKGVSRQMYLEEGMPTIPEGKMESFIDDAIQSEKGMEVAAKHFDPNLTSRTLASYFADFSIKNSLAESGKYR